MLNCASVSSRISPGLPPCFYFVCQSHRSRLSVTPKPYVLVKETLNEFDQSSGRVVNAQKIQHNTEHATQEQEKQDACFLSFSLSLHLVNTLFHFSKTMTMITGSLVVCGMWVKCFVCCVLSLLDVLCDVRCCWFVHVVVDVLC